MKLAYNFGTVDSQYIPKVNGGNFKNIALDLFRYQYDHNLLYQSFVRTLHIDAQQVQELSQIPFLPISFFKTHEVISGTKKTPRFIFESSGTTGEIPSRHFVFNEDVYETSLFEGFSKFYGDVKDYAILALLPSYLERKNASLVQMAKVLMEKSEHPENDFYLDDFKKLHDTIQHLEAQKQPVILIGVTFALLDFAASFPMQLNNTIVMETGGMKGRKIEWTRTEVHEYLKKNLGLSNVHSEYGMTELLSQAYSKENGLFYCADTMRVFVRDFNDPLETKEKGSGCLNIIDLANVDSCAFIATEDIGIVRENGSFEVLGRMDHSALRGCSLMAV